MWCWELFQAVCWKRAQNNKNLITKKRKNVSNAEFEVTFHWYKCWEGKSTYLFHHHSELALPAEDRFDP